MIEYAFKRKDRITRREAHDLIVSMVKYGNNYHAGRPKTDADVKRTFQGRGVSFDDVVEKCRNYNEKITFFENLLPSTLFVSNGAKVSRVDNLTGEEDCTVEGPGMLSMSTYWSQYEQAEKSLEEAIRNQNYNELLAVITAGIASIESYIMHRVDIWNKLNPTDQLIDSKSNKVSFDEKIDAWIPKMSEGNKLDKSNKVWADYKFLRSIRDNVNIHAKHTGYGVSFVEMIGTMNRFKFGIARMLFALHRLFEEEIPAQIIRGSFAPDVELIEQTPGKQVLTP